MVKYKRLKLLGAITAGVIATAGSFASQSSAQTRTVPAPRYPQGGAQGPFAFPNVPNYNTWKNTASDQAVRPVGLGIQSILPANGTQDYVCRSTATGFTWAFSGPRASLFENFNYFGAPNRLGVHYNLQGTPLAGGPSDGPRWEVNGSVIRGRLNRSVPAANPAADIPSLLLNAEVEVAGFFTGITQITRENLNGGVAPTGGCTQETIGRLVAVPYQAIYFFWGPIQENYCPGCGEP
jgi:Protein of unknown function (DUF3455)